MKQTVQQIEDEQTRNAAFPMQAQELQDAFGAFNQLSAQLSESYQQLEVRVAGLTAALETEQDERIKELTEKERVASRLASLLHALPGGVVVIDDEGKVQEHNPAAELLLGQPLLGLPWSEIIQRAFHHVVMMAMIFHWLMDVRSIYQRVPLVVNQDKYYLLQMLLRFAIYKIVWGNSNA